jgi:hypothetical protein
MLTKPLNKKPMERELVEKQTKITQDPDLGGHRKGGGGGKGGREGVA